LAAFTINIAESKFRYTHRPAQLADGWIGEMFSLAVAGLRQQELPSAFENVTFVNFNYDRAIEQYLYRALQERTSARPEEAKATVESLNMIRPYGSIGQFSPNMHDPFSFGTTAYFDPFSRLADLGTYTDQKPKHDVAAMNDALTGAALKQTLCAGEDFGRLVEGRNDQHPS
jgi:hypothetical protein